MKRLRLIIAVFMVIAAISVAWTWYIAGRNLNSEPRTAQGSAVTPQPQHATLEITYIANEGVLISSGDTQVLIDGLHREYKPSYAFLPAAPREKIETAKTPFDRINLILVSHLHLDHFHPESIGLHLQHNPKAMLVSSQQVVDEVKKNFKDYEAIKARMTGATPPLKAKVAMNVAGIDFEILGLRHGGENFRWIQNLGHIIKLGGKKLLHIGDADTSLENFQTFNLAHEGIDIAFIPFWFLLDKDAQTLVREHIRPKHIIAVHIPNGEGEQVARQIKQVFPDAVAFTTMLEKRNY